MFWKSDDSFPPATGGWTSWRPPFGQRTQGESAVRRAARRWHPLDPLLVAIPGSKRMLPPICHPELTRTLQQSTIVQYNLLLTLMAVLATGFAVAGIGLDDGFFLRAALAMALLFAFVLAQQLLIYRNVDRLRSQSLFVSWCYMQPRRPVMLVVVLMLSIGALQAWTQAEAGGLSQLIDRYGLVFEKAGAEPWRYLVGPFLHSGIPHWAANFSLLVVAAGLCFALGRTTPLSLLFLAGVIVPSFVLAHVPHWIGRDAFVGISGGVFALYGWVAGVAHARKSALPYGLWWIVGYFAIATAAVASLLDPRASWFVHLFGFALGLAAGSAGLGYKVDGPSD